MNTKYFGVIGNRDYIKLGGEKRPFWEFLDKQPDGWLSSIVYQRHDFPQNRPRMIFDCGAWSYRNEDVPQIGKALVTPQYALEKYLDVALYNDFVIAPDHMLIPGVDIEKRRIFNLNSAEEFLEIANESKCFPMATVHGMDLQERIDTALQYIDMGYSALALGGMAARASQKALMIEMVSRIKESIPSWIWLHVLGLSSPDYAVAWNELGVNSFDGSSHFKQAFTGGVFFTREGTKLIKHQATRPNDVVPDDMPTCYCRACFVLRPDGIDTRTYGSNENNMGRAAHNMNMLMAAQGAAINGQVVLVACAAKKQDYASEAQELYISDLFQKSRLYAETHGDSWYVLSAQYGLLEPERIIEPYNKTLKDLSTEERWNWAERVAEEIQKKVPKKSSIVILAGKDYREPLITLLDDYYVSVPMYGLGIGEQLAWLNNANTTQLKFDL